MEKACEGGWEFLYHKIHETGKGKVVACCDKELSGKVLEQGELLMKVRGDFYGKDELGEERLAELLGEANNVNLLGEKAVGVALEKGVITEGDVRHVAGVPHVQIFRV